MQYDLCTWHQVQCHHASLGIYKKEKKQQQLSKRTLCKNEIMSVCDQVYILQNIFQGDVTLENFF